MFLALGFGTPNSALAQQLPPIVYNASTSEAIVLSYAVRYGVNGEHLYKTLQCESGLISDAVGDKGLAIGVAQIRLDYHPDITKAEALDPFFSINFAAKEFAAGHASEWSCWREQFGNQDV